MLFLGKPMVGNKNGAAVLQQKLQNIVFVVNLLQIVATNPTLDFPLRRVLIGKWNWKCFFLCVGSTTFSSGSMTFSYVCFAVKLHQIVSRNIVVKSAATNIAAFSQRFAAKLQQNQGT